MVRGLFSSLCSVAAFTNEVSLLMSTAVLNAIFSFLTCESSLDSFFSSFLEVSNGNLDAYMVSCG